MNSNKIEANSSYKLYGSAVTDSRNKASSLYSKRPAYNVPDLQLNKNYLSPNYIPTDRSTKIEEPASRFAMSYAGKVDYGSSKNNYEGYTKGRGSYNFDEPKSASRAPSTSNRPISN